MVLEKERRAWETFESRTKLERKRDGEGGREIDREREEVREIWREEYTERVREGTESRREREKKSWETETDRIYD